MSSVSLMVVVFDDKGDEVEGDMRGSGSRGIRNRSRVGSELSLRSSLRWVQDYVDTGDGKALVLGKGESVGQGELSLFVVHRNRQGTGRGRCCGRGVADTKGS